MSMLAPIFFSLCTLNNPNYSLPLAAMFILLICAFGDAFDYFCGYLAKKLLDRSAKFQKLLQHQDLAVSIAYFQKYGSQFVMMASCIPVLHSTCSYVAGSLKYSFLKFILANTWANFLIIGLCYVFGRLLGHIPFVKNHSFLVIGTIVSLFFITIFSISYYINKQNNKIEINLEE